MQEVYKPLCVEIYQETKASEILIRGIWIADVAHQGASSLSNKDKLGDDREPYPFTLPLYAKRTVG